MASLLGDLIWLLSVMQANIPMVQHVDDRVTHRWKVQRGAMVTG